ncbi:3-oxoacyl-[acyl-carrier-protein] reductase [Geobacillus sp. GHH01]|uniref:SDR family NAD(P)-dependent oxidoreductase n=1 Tax=Geobacillus TaxID=129337 RepID=UPI0002AF4199|nr:MULTISPECIES: glucose 1-dehydrogenase [Geobacillus]AGE21920.1 3-oxoacyl-[acyl-carrier-protein] reductase [Geobacillus sp. GHH01]QNU24825.1 glucose 1-dehydrogenase [Geobacillus zalihae]
MDISRLPSFRLDGKVALVTGGSKGIGFAMACALAAHGAHVVIASRNMADLQKAAEEITGQGFSCSWVQADVTDKENVQRMVDCVIGQHGRLDILVNNAGMNIRKPLIDIEEDDWDRVLNTNLKGIFLVGQAAAKQMIKQQYGKIINISSIFGGVGMPFQTSYAASKGGINQLTKVWANELAPYNINVNAIAPAYIRTPMTSAWLQDEERYRNIVNSTMLNRVGEPEDVAGPVVFLASDAANYITGHILYVDGGWTAK